MTQPVSDLRVARATAFGVVLDTWKALIRPRWLVPILAVVIPMLLLQVRYSTDDRSLFIGGLLCAAFVALAPLSWRICMQRGAHRPLAALFGLIAFALSGIVVIGGIGVLLPEFMHIPPTFLTFRATLVSCLALYLVGGWGLGRALNLEQEIATAYVRTAQLEHAAEHAQLLALKSHLDPHFLFNTLNAIAEWCRTDGVVAERAVLQLSELLREVMGGIEQTHWPLAREVALVERLFALHAVRDEHRFRAEIDVESAAKTLNVPPMMLLPLAENAMKHGPAAGHLGMVSLSIRQLDGCVTIALSNPGTYRGPRVGGAGLSIVERRLRLSFGASASFTIAAADARTVATIVIQSAQDSHVQHTPVQSTQRSRS
jgi:two-component system, LytTR family, sensor histidine kinase AlgZ